MEKYNVSNKNAQEARYHDDANDMCYLILLKQFLHTLPKKLGTIIPWMWRNATLLYRDAFIQKRFYTQTLLHTDTFTHRRFHTETLLHAQNFLHTDAFTDGHFYTQTFYTHIVLHTDAFTHKGFYTQKLLHTDTFTDIHFYTHTLQTHLHTDTSTCRSFYTKTLFHTEAFTDRLLYTQTLLQTKPVTHRRFYRPKLTDKTRDRPTRNDVLKSQWNVVAQKCQP